MIERFFLALFDALPPFVVGMLFGAGLMGLYREFREFRDK